ncbi:MAG: Crp/Fnr family transcriptional regulator [Thioclava sp.]|nr:Crp/Fnr family transcriptional regulator [Thioclava sp.]MBD3802724.1 Crp/Fnr family transcriptional regulator [Thioclava sp.]
MRRGLEDLTKQPDFGYLAELVTARRIVAPGASCLAESRPSLARIESGIVMRYSLLEDGRRQIEGLLYPGDLCGLCESVIGGRGSYYEAVTALEISLLDPADARLRNCPGEHPAEHLLWLLAREVVLLSQWIASVGQRNAPEGIAWFIHHVWQRAEEAGMILRSTAPFPFSQQVVADVLGLSLVHTNKTMRRLSEEGLFWISRGRVQVPSHAQLRQAAAL